MPAKKTPTSKRKTQTPRQPAARARRPVSRAGPRPVQPQAIDLLKSLSEAVGVSGDEGAVRKLIQEAVGGHADDVRVDALGNLIAVKRGKGRDTLRLMVAAHMDEVGVMIVGIDSDGLLRFEAVGGVDDRILLGKPVWVGAERAPGVIGAKPIHLTKRSEREQVVKTDSLRIDIGAGSKEAAGKKVKPGDRATFATGFDTLGRVARGKALDDRAGCAVLIELLRGGPYPCELHAAFTVQEEVGLRGARVAAYGINPQAAFALDCTPANDFPGPDGEENVRPNTYLGRGPALYVADLRTISDRRLVDHVVRTARARNLPYQFRQPGAGGTDAGAIHLTREGVPAMSISIPGRYLHAPAAMISLDDLNHTVELMRAVLEGANSRILKRSS